MRPPWTGPGEPPLVDRLERLSRVRTAECRGGQVATSERFEAGQALRRRLPDGTSFLAARSLPDAPVEALPEPVDPLPLARAARGTATARVQTSWTAILLEGAAFPERRFRRELHLASLAVASGGTWLYRHRLDRSLDAGQVAREARELRAAAELLPGARAWAPGPAEVLLAAPVAAAILAHAWGAWGRRAVPPSDSVELLDDPTPAGGPLGAPFDAEGRPSRVTLLSGRGAEALGRLGALRASFADPPQPGPANLRLRALAPAAEPPGSPVTILAAESLEPAGHGLRALLLGRDRSGVARRLLVRIDLETLLRAVVAAGAETWWTPALGCAGCPWLVLELPRRVFRPL